MVESPASLDIRAAYDTVAGDYARLLPDLRAETSLDRAMLATFAELTRTAALGPVGDLGCGTGRVAAHLHSLGVDVFGVDVSPAMIAVARRTYPHLRFDTGSITDLQLPDASLGGALAWYSTIHTPPQHLRGVFAEFARVLAPGGYLLVGFHVGHGQRPITQAYGHAVSFDAYDMTVEEVAKIAARAGLTIHTKLQRSAQGQEKRPQGSLIAAKPSP